MNVTYYLNKRHPEHETHCSYHNEDPDPVKNGTGKQKAAYKPAKPAVNTPRTTETADPKSGEKTGFSVCVHCGSVLDYQSGGRSGERIDRDFLN